MLLEEAEEEEIGWQSFRNSQDPDQGQEKCAFLSPYVPLESYEVWLSLLLNRG